MGKLAKAKAALAEVASTNVTNGATKCAANNGVTSADWMLTKKEKKKMKEEAAAVVAAANASMDVQNNVKEKKKAKKRKLEEPTLVPDATSPTLLEPSMLPRGRLRPTPGTTEDTDTEDTVSDTGDTVSDTAVASTGVRF